MHKSSTLNIKLPYRAMIAFLLSLILIFTSIPIHIQADETGDPAAASLADTLPEKFFTLGSAEIQLYMKGYAKQDGIYKATASHPQIWVVCYRLNNKDYLISQQPTSGGITGASQTDILNARCVSQSDIRPHPSSHWQSTIEATVENVRLSNGNKTYQGYPITGVKAIKAILPGSPCVANASATVATSPITIINQFKPVFDTNQGNRGIKPFNWLLADNKLIEVDTTAQFDGSVTGYDTMLKKLDTTGNSTVNFLAYNADTNTYSYKATFAIKDALVADPTSDVATEYQAILEVRDNLKAFLRKEDLGLTGINLDDYNSMVAHSSEITNKVNEYIDFEKSQGMSKEEIRDIIDIKDNNGVKYITDPQRPTFEAFQSRFASVVSNDKNLLKKLWNLPTSTYSDTAIGKAASYTVKIPYVVELDVKVDNLGIMLTDNCSATLNGNRVDIVPAGLYHEGFLPLVNTCVNGSITTTNCTVNTSTLYWENSDYTLKEEKFLDGKSITYSIGNPTQEATITITLEINPILEGDKRKYTETIPMPDPYENNIKVLKIVIPGVDTNHNIVADSVSAIPDYSSVATNDDGTISISCVGNFSVYNLIGGYFPQNHYWAGPWISYGEPDLEAGDYWVDEPITTSTFKATASKFSNPYDITSSTIPVKTVTGDVSELPLGVEQRGLSNAFSIPVPNNYTGYVKVTFNINDTKQKPTNESTYNDNIVSTVVFVVGRDNIDSDIELIPPGNDRVTRQLPTNVFQVVNNEDLKHDDVPHAAGTKPVVTDNTSPYYTLCNGGQFTIECPSVNWGVDKGEAYYTSDGFVASVSGGKSYGMPVLNYRSYSSGYCTDVGSSDSTCSKDGSTISGCKHSKTIAELDEFLRKNQRYTSFLYYEPTTLLTANPSGRWRVVLNVPKYKVVFTGKCHSYCNHHWVSSYTDSDGNYHPGYWSDNIHPQTGSVYEIQVLAEPVKCVYTVRWQGQTVNARDYDSGSKTTKAGYGFSTELKCNWYTDYPGSIKSQSFIQFPYFSTYQKPWEVTWLECTSSQARQAGYQIPKNIKDLSKQPVGYRYSKLGFREKFSHINYPTGEFPIWYVAFLSFVPSEPYWNSTHLTQGDGSKAHPKIIIGSATQPPTTTYELPKQVIKIKANAWDDSHVYDGVGD